MLAALQRAVRATGADPPGADPRPAHPGVALESWFWRWTDPAAGRVVLAAVTLCRDAAGAPWASVTLAGRGPRGGRHIAHRTVEAPVASTRELHLSLPGVGVATADTVDLRLSEHDALRITLSARRDWPAGRLGGLGLGHVVPGLTQYWHPHLLGAVTRGHAELGGRTVDLGAAHVYAEKNWGRGGAPPAWWWGQGVAEHGDVVVAFAGGKLRVGPARIGATAVAARVGDEVLSCTPPLGRPHAARAGRDWRVTGRDGAWEVVIDGRTRSAPFVLPVPVAGTRTTAPSSHQHQDAELAIEIRRRGRRHWAGTAPLAGLELGGSAVPP